MELAQQMTKRPQESLKLTQYFIQPLPQTINTSINKTVLWQQVPHRKQHADI
jgi:hypothetical protein